MSLKWDGQFKKAKEINDWAWWALGVAIIVTEIIVVLKMLGKI